MKIKFNFKIDEDLGTIYELPIFQVQGGFDGETELDEFITMLSNDIKEKVSDYILKKKSK